MRARVLAVLLALSTAACAGAGVAGLTGPTLVTAPSASAPSPSGVATASGFQVRDFDYGSVPASAGPEADRRWQALLQCTGLRARLSGVPFYLHAYSVDSNGAAGFELQGGRVGGYYIDHNHGGPEVHVIGDPGWSFSWEHEELHLLLDLVTGDADGKHKSPLFARCTDHLTSLDFSRDVQ